MTGVRLTGQWRELLGALDPVAFDRLLRRNVQTANRAAGVEVADLIRRRVRDQVGMVGNGSVGPGRLHPYTVHRRNTRRLDAAARGGDRRARRIQSRQGRRGRLRPYRLARSPHKRLVDHGQAGLLGSIRSKAKGWELVVGINRRARRRDGKDPVNVAHVQEFGRRIAVTPKMRAYLHATGLHLSPSTTHIEIPAQHFMRDGVRAGASLVEDHWAAATLAAVRGQRYRPNR